MSSSTPHGHGQLHLFVFHSNDPLICFFFAQFWEILFQSACFFLVLFSFFLIVSRFPTVIVFSSTSSFLSWIPLPLSTNSSSSWSFPPYPSFSSLPSHPPPLLFLFFSSPLPVYPSLSFLLLSLSSTFTTRSFFSWSFCHSLLAHLLLIVMLFLLCRLVWCGQAELGPCWPLNIRRQPSFSE